MGNLRGNRGTHPVPALITDDRTGNRLVVRTDFYEVVHDLAHGGALSDIRLFHGSDRNLLLQTMGSGVRVSGPAGEWFADLHAAAPQVSCRQDGDKTWVEARGHLRDSAGGTAGIQFHTTYRHGWGYVRVCKRFVFPAAGLQVRDLSAHHYAVRRELSRWGYRPAPEAEPDADPFGFAVFQWGRCRAGTSFDTPFSTRFIPRQIVTADPGREGLEWCAASDLSQWSYQVTGHAGHGSATIAPRPDGSGVSVDLAPLALPRGDCVLSGEYAFEFYIGFPILAAQAQRPFLHTSFNRHNWPSEETIRRWAASGIRSVHFHHDGDSFDDGLFWRDGAYPPFGPADMAEYDRVITTCRRAGIRVATYFSNKELHPSTEAYQQHGEDWGRKPDDRGALAHNRHRNDEFGAQMCLRSGWLDYFKSYVDSVLSHHALDGVYYDWNCALYCQNPAHAPGKAAAAGPSLGALALSPAGHCDVDELVELMEWTRRRVGPDGLVIVHNTMVPCVITENFADSVVAMEWGYGKLSSASPALDDLPLEWDFMGGRPRGVIAQNCIATGGEPSIERQMALRCLVTGATPWPPGPVGLEVFRELSGTDLTRYQFLPWSRHAVASTNPALAAALYVSPDALLLIVVNLSPGSQSGRCEVLADVLDQHGIPSDGPRGVRVRLDGFGMCVRKVRTPRR